MDFTTMNLTTTNLFDNNALSQVAVDVAMGLKSSPVSYPFYVVHEKNIIPGIDDKFVSLFSPIIGYWSFSLFFYMCDVYNLFEKYRIYESEEVQRRNKVTIPEVIKAVIFQHGIQTLLGMAVLEDDLFLTLNEQQIYHGDNMAKYAVYLYRLLNFLSGQSFADKFMLLYGHWLSWWIYWWGVPAFQLFMGCVVLDTWQYWLHRSFHVSKTLYRKIHSIHHRLYCPYAFGALYNHPIEGFLLDTCGTAVAHFVTMLTTRQAIVLFTLSTMKTVDDHCGYSLPFDPFQIFFYNNAPYHDAHHQITGLKKNFSQPYFVCWDVICGTRMEPSKTALERTNPKARQEQTFDTKKTR